MKSEKECLLNSIGMIASKGTFEGCLTQTQSKRLRLAIILNVLIYGILFITFIIAGCVGGEEYFDIMINGVIVVATIFAIELIIICVVLFYFFHQRKKVKKWLEDAIECEGYTEIIDMKKSLRATLLKLKIDFVMDGEIYTRTTGDSSNLGDYNAMNGYYSGIEKFADKEVKVLYSPKYDEVMILND